MHHPLNIKITYQGAPLTEKFYNNHPEIHGLYPSKEKFMNEIYLPLLKKSTNDNTHFNIEISEHGVEIKKINNK